MMKMIIEKQKRKFKYYSLKSPKNDGNYYIYVWDKRTYDPNEVKEAREKKGTRNYSKVKGWKSKGNINNPESWERLFIHLNDVYGTIDEQEIREDLWEKQQELEQQRIEELNQYNGWIDEHLKRHGIEGFPLPTELKLAKKMWKELNS